MSCMFPAWGLEERVLRQMRAKVGRAWDRMRHRHARHARHARAAATFVVFRFWSREPWHDDTCDSCDCSMRLKPRRPSVWPRSHSAWCALGPRGAWRHEPRSQVARRGAKRKGTQDIPGLWNATCDDSMRPNVVTCYDTLTRWDYSQL